MNTYEKSEEKSVFEILSAIDVSKYVKKKNGFTYLPWARAWAEVKKNFPDAFYTIYEGENDCLYRTDGKTCWVKTGVTIKALEHIESLPVMDFKNNSITVDRITSVDANKAIQRSLTKACARHGLGINIFADLDFEDLPDEPEPLSPDLLAEAEGLGIALERAAAYCKKDVSELTNADLKECIEIKKKNLAKKEAANG